jgi:hypothetical protein
MAYTTIDDPSAHFQVMLHTTANGATRTNDGNSDLQPDFLWSKDRDSAYNHALWDSTRGVSSFSSTNNTAAQTVSASGYDLTAFSTDGFTTGNNQFNAICGGSHEYVAWQWKANGGTTSSNTDGNITTVIQANTTAGFSIVTYDGTGVQTGKTVGHGLGAVPKMVISKDRDATSNVPGWRCYHQTMGSTKYINVESSAAMSTYTDWDNTDPTSSVYSIGGSGGYTPTNTNNTEYFAYVFADVQGYSKFGGYTGNGSTDGCFVYTGFKPAFVMIKSTSAVSNWAMFDHKRIGYNDDNNRLYTNANNAEETSDTNIDLLSNGFKLLTADTDVNNGGSTYLYAAIAEQPFVTSTGIPCTAR